MSPKPISAEQLRALRQPQLREPQENWRTVPEDDADEAGLGFPRQNLAAVAMAAALALALVFLGWVLWGQASRVSRELDETKLALAAANGEVARIQTSFAQASVIHDLWGLGSRFAAASAGACSADDDRKRVRADTSRAIEMWSDSSVRAEIDLEGAMLPVLRGLDQQHIQVVGASLPAGVLAQYRRFRREALGDVVMLDPSRMTDSDGRAAVLAFLRRAGEGQLDPAKTAVLFRHDDYGAISYTTLQGPADASLLRVRLSDEPTAEPVTVAAAGFPCS